ncbi:peroxisomal (S)-2-hydroxy-acid oxidase GLO1 [Chrysoperla carnea]|uniref:peroxisomal (S)-2-hydroxy-acid oxidase GLO1 n=1 Tax=Chrysoperla carnea TaxID=189513 RepID=UPI001D061405|nr:peroxisomal (S)-2-hydroxy-acid oxidase GLO1 [Chrysoperla carnea]
MNSNFVSVKDFKEYAHSVLPRNSLDYYRSGAAEQLTLALNKQAFNKLRIRPRMLVDVSKRDLSTTILGEKVSMPVGVSPSAMQKMAHPDGEAGNARACEAAGTIYILSTLSTTSIEDVAKAAPKCVKWFQLYIYTDRAITRNLVSRAERAGFKALALTVDAPLFGVRRADIRNKFCLPKHLRLANFEETDSKSTKIQSSKEGSGLQEYVNGLFDASITWNDIAWLKSITKLPIVLKGILTKEDAILARQVGVQAILVSNHGARQLDGTPASIEALPEIVKAVGKDLEIYMDGGVDEGTDVFKALALGARMCFMGRPALWGLATDGENGVKAVLNILRNEFDYALALTGCTSVRDIKPEMVVHESFYSRL